MESIFAIIFSLLIGGAALSSGVTIIRVNRKVKRWPTVAGALVDREIVLSSAGSVARVGSRYRATVKYTYDVAGQHYTGDKIIPFGYITGSQDAMQKELDGFNGPFEVRFDPENPADACLKIGPSWWAFGSLAAAALCFLVGLVTLVTWLKP